jgi:hypothetical protein
MAEVEPSVPLVVYFFADRLLPPRKGANGMHLPCSAESVQTQSLAVLLLSVAFWSLREQDLVELHLVHHSTTRWPVHHHDVNLKRLDRDSRPGLEGALLENLEDETTLCDVVSKWSTRHSNNPWHEVIEEEVAEAAAAGYLRSTSADGVLTRLLGSGTELESDCTRIAGLDGDFLRFQVSWSDFQENEPLLHDHLRSECKRALLTCTECWYP